MFFKLFMHEKRNIIVATSKSSKRFKIFEKDSSDDFLSDDTRLQRQRRIIGMFPHIVAMLLIVGQPYSYVQPVPIFLMM